MIARMCFAAERGEVGMGAEVITALLKAPISRWGKLAMVMKDEENGDGYTEIQVGRTAFLRG
jgi:hypothetical protein